MPFRFPTPRRPHLLHRKRGTTRRYHAHRARGLTPLAAVLAVLGPGLLAGLSDDDPAGIATYSILGTDHGYLLLWTIPLSTALLIYFHLLGVRLGMHTGKGFSTIVRERYGLPQCMLLVVMFVVANLGTLLAEYLGIVAAAELVGIPPAAALLAAGLVVGLVLTGSFRRIEHVLLALSMLLASYVVAGVIAHPSWSDVAQGSIGSLGLPAGSGVAAAIAATLGTTLAPWGLAFIQSYAVDKGLRMRDYRYERIDVIAGSLLTGVIGLFVAITCAATLHGTGVSINTAADAARALEPLAGAYAALLFGVGLVAAALVAAVVVALATSYEVSEAFGRPARAGAPIRSEHLFYGVFTIVSVVAALAATGEHLAPMQLIFWTQVLNTVLLVPQIVTLLRLNCDEQLLGQHVLGPRARIAGWAGIGVVGASVALLALA
jgi:Mn2+/Fe2+ NRAMP family transporter